MRTEDNVESVITNKHTRFTEKNMTLNDPSGLSNQISANGKAVSINPLENPNL